MHCAGCGNELQEGAIICRCCARIVQFKTHFSPADIDPPLPVYPESKKLSTLFHSDLFRWGVFFSIFCCVVLVLNLALTALEQQSSGNDQWSMRISISDVSIDRFTFHDRVVVTGQITNVTDRNLQDVVIRAYVVNAVSQPIGEEYYYTQPEILLPDEASSFTITIPCRVTLVQHVKIEIFDAQVQPEIKRPVKLSRMWVTGS